MKMTKLSLSALIALPLVALAGCHSYKETGINFIRQNNADLKGCFQEAAARNPNLKGQMELAFEIDPTGKVNRLNITKDEFKDPILADCVKIKSTAWTFPAPTSGKNEVFTYGFTQ